MVALYQHLESRFDIGAVGVGFKAEHIQRAALRVENLAALGRASCMARTMVGPAPPCLAEQGERIICRFPIDAVEIARRARLPPSAPIFHVGRWPVSASFWYCAIASSLMPAKKLYELLYSRTCSRQNCQYSLARSRPLGARCVAGPLHPGHWQGGSCARKRRSWSGFTRMRSNSGESLLIIAIMRERRLNLQDLTRDKSAYRDYRSLTHC